MGERARDRASTHATLTTVTRLRRAARRGVTLVEVLIVVAIMALIAGGVSFFVIPKLAEARKDTARTATKDLRRVAVNYRALKGKDCPTIQTLLDAKELDIDSPTKDPWNQTYKIVCDGDNIRVISFGPDEKEGTEDDIVSGAGKSDSKEEK